MQPIYEHRQFGRAMLILLLAPTLFFAVAIGTLAQVTRMPPLWIFLVFMLITAYIFSSLTVKVDPRQVQLYFGPGVFRRTIPLDTIAGVRVVRNEPWMGLGIHFFRNGLIYNVSGLDGIELSLRNGRLVRIGSDEPQTLARAIEEAVSTYVPNR